MLRCRTRAEIGEIDWDQNWHRAPGDTPGSGQPEHAGAIARWSRKIINSVLVSSRGWRSLPVLMHLRFHVSIINLANFFHRLAWNWRQARGGGVIFGLGWSLCARNSAGDCREHQNPPQ